MKLLVKETFVCNSRFMSKNGKALEAIASRIVGQETEPTVKVDPLIFEGNLPLPGEAYFLEYDPDAIRMDKGYRVLTNAKFFGIGKPVEAANEATEEAEPIPF